jgi:hypothetical protein
MVPLLWPRVKRHTPIRPAALILALSLVMLFQPSHVIGTGVETSYSADAFWSYTNDCIDTFVGIFPVSGGTASGQLEQRDICTDPATPLMLAAIDQSFAQVVQLEINSGLSKAMLHAEVSFCDAISNSCFPVTIDLQYERVGGRGDCNADPLLVPPPQGEVTIFCNATVNGTVTDGTTNFTPVPGVAVFQLHKGFVP